MTNAKPSVREILRGIASRLVDEAAPRLAEGSIKIAVGVPLNDVEREASAKLQLARMLCAAAGDKP